MRSKHRPKLGDIIYGLPFLRHLYKVSGEKQTLFLDPNSPYFSGEVAKWARVFEELAPLIQKQYYINKCQTYNGEHIYYDLDLYMVGTDHLKQGVTTSIVANHFLGQGINPKPEDFEPWLECPKKKLAKIVVNYSGRYVDPNVKYDFLKDKDWIFVGTEDEAKMFSHRTGFEVRYQPCRDIEDLAEIINGCDLFVGNQSFPLALAQGLGKKCLVEVSIMYPNSAFRNYEKIDGNTTIGDEYK